jgi:hypothetical protein
MQLDAPLSLTSPHRMGKGDCGFSPPTKSLFGEADPARRRFSFSASEGEKSGKRIPFNYIVYG